MKIKLKMRTIIFFVIVVLIIWCMCYSSNKTIKDTFIISAENTDSKQKEEHMDTLVRNLSDKNDKLNASINTSLSKVAKKAMEVDTLCNASDNAFSQTMCDNHINNLKSEINKVKEISKINMNSNKIEGMPMNSKYMNIMDNNNNATKQLNKNVNNVSNLINSLHNKHKNKSQNKVQNNHSQKSRDIDIVDNPLLGNLHTPHHVRFALDNSSPELL